MTKLALAILTIRRFDELLRDLPIRPVYSSDEADLLREFYVPALSASTSYDRAVGFFSAQMLSLAAQGLAALIQREGTVRLVVGAALAPEEDLAIRDGYLKREVLDQMGREFCEVIDDIADGLVRNRLETLSWLVAGGRLDIKVALRPQGMFHDKLGVLYDDRGDSVVFQGSANETAYAVMPDFNFESISVFPSWRAELHEHYQAHKDRFTKLWENKLKGTLVVPFPAASQDKLLTVCQGAPYPSISVELGIATQRATEATTLDEPEIPNVLGDRTFEALPHQSRALRRWRASDFTGILKHATGAGKTVTAIYGATRLWQQVGSLFLLVAVPYQNLADQWMAQLRLFGWRPVPCYRARDRWQSMLGDEISDFDAGVTRASCVVVVMRTLGTDLFQSMIRALKSQEHLMFVGDECHHLSSHSASTTLPTHARYRLGLSATPEDQWSPERTDLLQAYFGSIVHEFSLRDALLQDVLSPYTYEVVLCELNEDEADKYIELTALIARVAADEDHGRDTHLQPLLGRRSRLLAHCEDKLVKLTEIVQRDRVQPLSLFYCGDGAVEGDSLEPSLRHVQRVTSVLHEAGWKASIFTAEETLDDRRRIMANFEAGLIDAVAAIRCLDEGIDVPACRTAYILASSRNSRQFIQRRGRILRRAPGKTSARVVDFVVTLPAGYSGRLDHIARKLVRDELRRIIEFAKTASNLHDVFDSIKVLLEEYDLGHELAIGLGQ